MKAVGEHYVVDSEGNRTGVILSVEHYEQMREDLHDLAVIAERRGEKTVGLEEMKGRLRAEGRHTDRGRTKVKAAKLPVAGALLLLCSSLLVSAQQRKRGVPERLGNTMLLDDGFEYELLDYGVGGLQLRADKTQRDWLSPPVFWIEVRVTNESPHLPEWSRYWPWASSVSVVDNWGNTYSAWGPLVVIRTFRPGDGMTLPLPAPGNGRFKPGESRSDLCALALSEFVPDIHELRISLAGPSPHKFFALHEPMSRHRDLLRDQSEPSVAELHVSTGVESQSRLVPKKVTHR